MPPTFTVKRARSVKSEMSGWSLPPGVSDQVISALRSLSHDPDEQLIDVVDLNGQPLKLLRLPMADPQDTESVYLFMFHVEVDEDNQTVHILEADFERQFPGMDAGTPVM